MAEKLRIENNEPGMVGKGDNIVRLNLVKRIEHIILIVTSIMLLLTGLPMMYHDTGIGRFLIQLEGGSQGREKLHIIFAITLIAICVFHVFYSTFSDNGQKDISFLKFKPKDFKNLKIYVRYIFGFSNEKSPVGKYYFPQKIHYWLDVVAFTIMIVTGLVLLLKVTGERMIVPMWLWNITVLVHGYHGIFIIVVIFLWHIYDVHFASGIFPFNWVWITGKISIKKLEKDYPEEYIAYFSKGEENKGAVIK